MEYFDFVKAVKYEGPASKNPYAFKFYNADEVILGKKMSEHLPFAMAWWHNLGANGVDMFGRGTIDKSFGATPNTLEHAKAKVDAGFEFMKKMGIKYFCWHDVDLVPEQDDINETNTYWLTSMPEDGSNHLTTPHLVNLPDDRELALWADVGYDYDTFAKENNLYYQFLDHTGKPVGTVYSNKGNLSDCVPVVKGNKLVWYVHEENFVTFYEIDLGSGKLTKTLSRTNGWKDLESVNFSQDEILVTVGYRGELNTILLPEDATDTRVSVTSQNETVASYNVSSYYGNYVYGESEGETVIQATTPSGKKAECKVKVITPFEDYSIDYAPWRMYVSRTFDLNVSVKPEDHMKYVKYESSDPSVLSVSDKGVLTALKPGTSQIKVRCGSQTLSSRTIEVYRVDPESIKFDSNEATMVKGDSKNISATLTPNDAVKTLTWQSSNASVATVDDKGLVKALKAGKTTITATTVNGLSASCDVTVVDKEVKATGITLDKSELFVTRGYHDNLVATIMPENTTYKDVVWESSDENTATVNNGNVYGRNFGTATITATTNNGLQAEIWYQCCLNEIKYVFLQQS